MLKIVGMALLRLELISHDHCPGLATKIKVMLAREKERRGGRKITKSLIR